MPLEVYQWTLSGTLGGQFVQTVQHVQLDIAVSLSAFVSARNIALDFAGGGGHIEKLLDCLPSDYVATSIRVKKVGGAGGPTAIVLGSGFATTAGQRIGNISSAQANPLIIWIPATAPDKTGRLFLPGVSEDDIEDMALEATLIAACDTFITDYIEIGRAHV